MDGHAPMIERSSRMTIGFSHGSDFLDALLASLADAVYFVGAGRARCASRTPPRSSCSATTSEAELLGRPSHATIHSRRPDGSPFPEDECPLLEPRVTGETVRVELDWFVRRDGSPAAGRLRVRAAGDARRARRGRRLPRPDRAARRGRGRRLAGADRRRHRRRAAPDRPRPARRRAAAAGAGADGDRGGAPRTRRARTRRWPGRPPTPATRSTTCASWPTACTRSCSPTAGSARRSRSSPPARRSRSRCEVTEERFAPEVEAAAYFFVAEALTNAVKHAQRERRGRDDRAAPATSCASRSPTTGAAAPTRRAGPGCAGCRTASRCSAGASS